jgi:hypothetical protein
MSPDGSLFAFAADRGLLRMDQEEVIIAVSFSHSQTFHELPVSRRVLFREFLRRRISSPSAFYGLLTFLLALVTVVTWFIACTVASVVISGAVSLALLLCAAAVARWIVGDSSFFRSVGGLIFSFTAFFVLFAFVYAAVWLHDPGSLEDIDDATPRLGEMFLVSLGVARSGGTVAATVHEWARVVAYIEMLLVFSGVATIVAAGVNRYLLSGRSEIREEPMSDDGDRVDRERPDGEGICPECGRPYGVHGQPST